MLERIHYRRTSAGPGCVSSRDPVCQPQIQVSPRSVGPTLVRNVFSVCRTDGCGGFSPAAKVAPEAASEVPLVGGTRAAQTMGSPLSRQDVCIEGEMYPAQSKWEFAVLCACRI